MGQERLRVLVIGAHPDDCDITAAGTAARYAQLGHEVTFVSVTNGDAGHHAMGGGVLARRRLAESQAAAAVIGITYRILDNHDGQLLPTLERRQEMIELIRAVRPHLIMSPRPNDYHPDHRYTAQLIQDAAYMVTVPNVAAFSPHLALNPVIVYVSDTFQKPYPFSPDVIVPIDTVVDQKIAMLHAHESQFYEWLPYNGGYLDQVPTGDGERRAWLRERFEGHLRRDAERYRDLLVRHYGPERAATIRYAEAFEGCEYGGRLTAENIPVLFPFV
ncbi:MAG: PIG-L family deacetylase [Roseiflexaceae bacterium]